jgi:hypothetical protein
MGEEPTHPKGKIMAARKPRTETPFDFAAAEAVPTTLPSKGGPQPNPLLDKLRWTLEQDQALMLILTPEQAKEAGNLVRRGAQTLGVGQNIREVPRDDGKVEFHFRLKYGKRNMKYTNSDIREWALLAGYPSELVSPKIHPDVRKAYRIEHGYDKSE